jgi:4-hydroxythreonine-4-phosphate dehydrogenase
MSRMPLAITMGEPAGVGPELAAQAWALRQRERLPAFYVLADPTFLSGRIAAAGIAAPIEILDDPARTADVFSRALPVARLSSAVRTGIAGRPATSDAPAVIEAIDTAVADTLAGRSRAVVTAPIQKQILYSAGFGFPGHTEYLGELCTRCGYAANPVMMIACDALRVVPATIHVPLATVPALLSERLIVDTARIVARDLVDRFGIAEPRLAVAGLNPHAGEGGGIGLEDRDVIAPAIAALRTEGIAASGPHPADTLFYPAARSRYDAVIAMYHDQALIPIKTIAFEDAVNVTLGLPFVRTSPDHGTALTLAGTGSANPSSFIAAIRLADRLSAPRG